MIPGWWMPIIVTENHWFVNKKTLPKKKKKTVFGVHSQADQTKENVYILNIDSVRAVPHKHYFPY